MRQWKRMTAVASASAVLMVLGLAACGDDDGDESATATESEATSTTLATDDTAASEEPSVFCDALIEFNSAVNQVDLGPSSTPDDVKAVGEQLVPLFQKITDNAPDDVSAAADELNATVAPLADGDAAAFSDDATYEKYGEFVDAALSDCDVDKVEVTAKDYAFDAPDSVESGDVAFHMTNTSSAEQHVMVVLRKNDDVDMSFDELLKLPQEQAESSTTELGAAFAPPGGESTALVSLTPGDYAMVCFLPVGGVEGAPPHFTKGMVHEFTVE